jgi:hypothetical protein
MMGQCRLDRGDENMATANEEMQEWLNENYPGWTMGDYGDTFVCPHGNETEVDGTAFDGCVPPLIQAGLM